VIDAVGLFIIKDNRILLQLRDDKPEIPFPNCWSTFGGAVEEGETPLYALKRELKEELDYDVIEPTFIGIKEYHGYLIANFYVMDEKFEVEQHPVQEGQRGAFFTREELKNIPFAFNIKEVAEELFAVLQIRELMMPQ
jgi:8-oxo-dGTP diphosphatase